MKRRITLFIILAAVVLAVFAFSGCTGILGDFEVTDTPSEGGAGEGGGGKANGEGCAAGSECNSGFCTDGVCCESACKGTCESCALAEKGKCSPIPKGQDPDKECLSAVRPDAGPIKQIEEDGGADGGDAAVAADAGEVDAGKQINFPDGGVTSSDPQCGGACDGNRACKFPGEETTCGTNFCQSRVEAAGYRCNSKGLCELTFSDCKGYACEGESCRTQCSQLNDCDAKHFCNAQGVCQAKLGNGLECTLPTQCGSGFCSQGVCCNSECDSAKLPGANCKQAGSVGQCKCSQDCGPGGSCRLFYRDADGDGHGDPVVANATVGCVGATPPAGYAASNDDCNDADGRAFPGQTAYFDTPELVRGGYDFNCDKIIQKQTEEFPGATCRFCPDPVGKPLTCPASTSTCQYKNQGANLKCELNYNSLCAILGGTDCYTCGSVKGNDNTRGFTQTVPCGAPAQYTITDCGSCADVGQGPSTPTYTYNQTQRCH
jgi:hypothetical protein